MAGLAEAKGLNNYAMLVRVYGKVTSVGSGANAGLFYIDDGSDNQDGTVWDSQPNVGVRVKSSRIVNVGDYVLVTGLCSVFKNGATICALLYDT